MTKPTDTDRLGSTARTDVLVVGAGLAGLHTATFLARRGHDVLLIDRRNSLAAAVRTTGIFVRKTLDDFPLPPEHLGPPIRRVVLYPPDLRRPVTLVSGRDEYRVGDMGPLYTATAATATAAGVRIVLGTRYAGRQGDTFHLLGRDGPTAVRARFVVGADGARSSVACDLALDRNRHLLVGAEEVFELAGHDEPPTFHCVLDPSLAPGYLAWVVNDGQHAHVGVAGYADRFPGGLRRTLQRFSASAPGMTAVNRPEAAGPRAPHRAADRAVRLRRSRTARRIPRPADPAQGTGPGAHTDHGPSGLHTAPYAGRPGGGGPGPLRRQVLPDSCPLIARSIAHLAQGPGHSSQRRRLGRGRPQVPVEHRPPHQVGVRCGGRQARRPVARRSCPDARPYVSRSGHG